MPRLHPAASLLLLTACASPWQADGGLSPSVSRDARDVPPPVQVGCEEVRAESGWCLSVDVAGAGPVVMGLDSGDVCELGLGAATGLSDVRTVAGSQGDLVACDAANGTLGRWSPGGATVTVPGGCVAVGAAAAGLVAIADPSCAPGGCEEVGLYGSADELVARAASDQWPFDAIRGFALSMHGELLLSAHAGDLELFDIRTGARLGAQPLQDVAAPVRGLSPTGTGELALLVGDYVLLHDPDTGERLREVPISMAGAFRQLGGLDCHPGGATPQ